MNGRIVGSVAIDGEDLAPGEAHLRWFILDDGCRGHGVGKKLLTEAMRFCDSLGFSAVHLWTFNSLPPHDVYTNRLDLRSSKSGRAISGEPL